MPRGQQTVRGSHQQRRFNPFAPGTLGPGRAAGAGCGASRDGKLTLRVEASSSWWAEAKTDDEFMARYVQELPRIVSVQSRTSYRLQIDEF